MVLHYQLRISILKKWQQGIQQIKNSLHSENNLHLRGELKKETKKPQTYYTDLRDIRGYKLAITAI